MAMLLSMCWCLVVVDFVNGTVTNLILQLMKCLLPFETRKLVYVKSKVKLIGC